MKNTTIEKYNNLLNDIYESHLSVKAFCEQHDISYKGLLKAIKRSGDEGLINHYNEIKTRDYDVSTVDVDRCDGNIISYKVTVPRKDKSPFIAELSRTDVETLFGLYTYYGGNVTARNVANEFPRFTLPEVKFLFRAFKLTKDSIWAPPHLVEEFSAEDLAQYRMSLKERAAFKYADATQEREFKKTLNKFALENRKLREQLDSLSEVKFIGAEDVVPYELPEYEEIGQSINLYISDMHLGSYVRPDGVYDENKNYGYEEAKRRLQCVIDGIAEFGSFDKINIVLMGDNIDCAGIQGYTASHTHGGMPENMTPEEQADAYVKLMLWFVATLADPKNKFTSKIAMYSVPAGNHDGVLGRAINQRVLDNVRLVYGVETELFNSFVGTFECNSHIFCVSHGKHYTEMKHGMPLTLDNKTSLWIENWMNAHDIPTKGNIHFVKGDLHNDALSSTYRFDYRNVLSLYGASDYSANNFTRNKWGVSYDMIIGKQLVRGIISNV